MSFKGFLVARTKESEEFFSSHSSYDNPVWSSFNEATVYPSVDMAEVAVKKLWNYGSYKAKIVSEASIDHTKDKSKWTIKNLAEWKTSVYSKSPKISICQEGYQRYVAKINNTVVGKYDNNLASCGYIDITEAMSFEFPDGEVVDPNAEKDKDNSPHNAFPKDEMVAKVQDDNPSQVEQDTDDENEDSTEDEDNFDELHDTNPHGTASLSQSQEDEEITVSRVRFRQGQKVNYNGKKQQVVSDSGTGVAVVGNVGDQSGKSNKRVDNTKIQSVGEGAELPAKPQLDAVTSPTVTVYPKTTIIKFNDPFIKKGEPVGDNMSDMDTKIKMPSEVASDLKDAINTFQKAYDHSNGRDDDRASFCLTTLDCLKQLQDDLSAGTVESIKQAQINITSWMNPIVNNIPSSVRKFIYDGGKTPSLKNLFDIKTQERKVSESVNHMGEREYQTYAGWKRAIKLAHPGCTFRGDVDIGAAVVNGKDVGEWDGAIGCIFKPSETSKNK